MNDTEHGQPGSSAAGIDSPTAALLLDACGKALVALNAAPRFKVPALDTPAGKTDSYMIAGLLGRAVRRAKGAAEFSTHTATP